MKRRGFIQSLGLASLGACSGLARASLASDVKIGMSTPADIKRNGVYVWVKSCTDRLEQAGFATRIYPNSTVGGERERTFQAQLGLLDINATGGDEIGRWSPVIAAGARPFVVNSYEHMSRIIDQTPYLDRISEELRPHGLAMVDVAYTASMVGLFTRKVPVRTLEDLHPLRLRVLSEADFALLRAWDVRGVQVAWEEVAQGLQTGIIDAYLNPPNVAVMFGHGSVLDYFTQLRMGPATRLIVAATSWLDSLPDAEREVFHDAVAAARRANREWTASTQSTDRANLQRVGIQWIDLTPAERQGWIDASRAIPPSHWEQPDITAEYLHWVEQTRKEGE